MPSGIHVLTVLSVTAVDISLAWVLRARSGCRTCHTSRFTRLSVRSAAEGDNSECGAGLDPNICSQFKILTCTSKWCSEKRQVLGMDQYATFGAMYERKERAGASAVEVEECPCLGRCKLAPCVAVEHEDFVGTVGLEGMTDAELNDSIFHKIISEGDCDRVWASVENGINAMAQEDES